MTYTYQTAEGLFRILQDVNGRWRLYIDDVYLGNYGSPRLAADDVFMCATGWDEWDQYLTVNHPADLSEWTRRP